MKSKSRKELLKKLVGKLLALEIELNVLNQDLEAITIDLTYLDSLRDDLIFNINVLRGDDLIVIMREYCRSIRQLKEVKEQTINIKNLQNTLQDKLDKKIKEHEKCLKKLELKFYTKEKDNILVFPKKYNNILKFTRKKTDDE